MTINTYTPEDLTAIEDLYFHGEPNAIKRDDFHAAQFAAQSTTPIFCLAAPEVMDQPDRDTFLWRWLEVACKSHYGAEWKWRSQYQRQGTCAGQSTKLAQDIVAAVQSVLYMQQFPGRFSVAANYAGGRVDISRQPGRWQGASMVSMAEWSTKFGSLLLKDLGLDDHDLDQDEAYALAWCNSSEGVPKNFETAARKFPIEGASLASTAREVGKAIQNGNPAIQGSSLIPTGTRTATGFGRVAPAGGHATVFTAVRYNPFGLLYQNSWSDRWGTGPVWPFDMPTGSVWLDEDESNAIIQQRQTYVLFTMKGLVPRSMLAM